MTKLFGSLFRLLGGFFSSPTPGASSGDSSDENAPDGSLRDSVTSLYNRRHLLQRLRENMARCDRKEEKMAVILWDIDGFMNFTNRFGQSAGDELLRKVGEVIRRSLRVYDEAFRSGPDEFCGLLVPADEKTALDVTKRVGQLVEKSLFEGEAEYATYQFSISSGLVFYPNGQNIPEAILHTARQELYKSRLTTHS